MQPAELHNIDLNLLYTFQMVVDAGGVAAAAKRLGRTQPAISARLRHLEQELGVTLFERIGRRLGLTPAGRSIEADARDVLSGVQRVVDRARSAQGEPAGSLRIGALPTVSAFIVGPHIAPFLEDYARAEVRLTLGLTRQQLGELRAGTLDVIVSVGPMPDDSDLHVRRLSTVRPALAMRRTDAPRGTVRISRLRRMNYIGFGNIGDLFFDTVWAYLRDHNLLSDMRIRVAHIESIKNMVLAGAGVSILPSYTIVEPELAARAVEGLKLTYPLWFAVRESARNVPLVEHFCDHLVRCITRAKA